MPKAQALKLTKDFELRSTALFSVFCLKGEPAFKVVAAPAPAASGAKGGEKKAAPKKPVEDDDDDDDDLDDMFGDSDEEKEAEWQAKIDAIAAEHNAKKEAKRIAKGKAKRRDINSYVFDVKPYDMETDLESMATGLKAISHGGIKAWGVEHQLILWHLELKVCVSRSSASAMTARATPSERTTSTTCSTSSTRTTSSPLTRIASPRCNRLRQC